MRRRKTEQVVIQRVRNILIGKPSENPHVYQVTLRGNEGGVIELALIKVVASTVPGGTARLHYTKAVSPRIIRAETYESIRFLDGTTMRYKDRTLRPGLIFPEEYSTFSLVAYKTIDGFPEIHDWSLTVERPEIDMRTMDGSWSQY